MPYQLAAVAAAALWAFSSLLVATLSRRLGGPRLTRLRMIWVCLLLVPIASLFGDWGSFRREDLALVAVSGVVGLLVGDVALFTAMARIGPRRTSVLFTANAPLAAVGGVYLFDETYTPWSFLGAVLTFFGITMAIIYGGGRPAAGEASGGTSRFEQIEGSLLAGSLWALLGALGQAVGALAAKPALDAGADTLNVAAYRAVIATVLMWMLARPTDALVKPANRDPVTARDAAVLFVSALIAMVVGMTLLLYALGRGDAGVVTLLSATTPVLMLPLLWATTGRAAPLPAWIGAVLAVVGTGLLI